MRFARLKAGRAQVGLWDWVAPVGLDSWGQVTTDLPPLFHPTAVREIPSKKMLRLAKSAGVKCPSEL